VLYPGVGMGGGGETNQGTLSIDVTYCTVCTRHRLLRMVIKTCGAKSEFKGGGTGRAGESFPHACRRFTRFLSQIPENVNFLAPLLRKGGNSMKDGIDIKLQYQQVAAGDTKVMFAQIA